MRITIDRSKCIGAGNCVLAAPSVFTQDDEDGLVIVLKTEPEADERPGALEAQTLCPAKVIEISQT